jgi:hypothetical protein
MGIGSKLKTAAKVAGGAALVAGTGGVGAAVVASKMQQNKVQKATYNITGWGPLPDDPSTVSLKYSPALSISNSDKLTVSGTPFDGEYSNPVFRTRNEVYIKPSNPPTQSGSGGSFKVKTSMTARAAGGASATKAGARTTAKKAGKAVSGAAGALWNKIKWYVYGMILLAVLVGGGYLFMQYKARQALMGAAAPPPAPVYR